MGKSFNDRNRKKGAERAYRKTKPKFKKNQWARETTSDITDRTQQAGSNDHREQYQPGNTDGF